MNMNFVKVIGVALLALLQGCNTAPESCMFNADGLMDWAKGGDYENGTDPAMRHESGGRSAFVNSRNGRVGCYADEYARSGYEKGQHQQYQQYPQQRQQLYGNEQFRYYIPQYQNQYNYWQGRY